MPRCIDYRYERANDNTIPARDVLRFSPNRKAAGWVNPLCFVAFFFFMAFAFWPLVFYAIDKQATLEQTQ